MANKKQTAVEWLVNHWKKLQLEGEKMSWQQIIDITELAKEMEKEQLLDMGYQFAVFGEDNPEQYYNETFGGNNE